MKPASHSHFVKLGALLLALSLSTGIAFADVEDVYRESFPLISGGQVSIGNINGSIEISGWDREEVSVVAVKRGKTQEIVDRIEIIIDSDKDSFSLKTKLPKIKGWFFWDGDTKGKVAYDIKVPMNSRLRKISSVNGAISIERVDGNVDASTVNGSLKVYELTGDVDLSAVNGSVKAVYSNIPQSESIKMDVVNGSLFLSIPANSSGYFKASTVNGGIRSDIGLPVKKRFPIGAHLDGRKGEGGPDIRLSSVNGRISIEES